MNKGTHKLSHGNSPKQDIPTGAPASLSRPSFEANKLHTAALLATPPSLPLHELSPGAFIHGVMDGHKDRHVACTGIMLFSGHGRVELGLGGIYPVPIRAVRARDRGCLARVRKRWWGGGRRGNGWMVGRKKGGGGVIHGASVTCSHDFLEAWNARDKL